MKKYNKLCAILFAVLGVTTLKAQTDVTSTHLTNAGFDDESGWKTSNVGVTSGGNMQDIPGWTKKAVGWSSAATFGYGGGGQVNGSSVPSTGPDGTSNGGAFGFSGSWDADIVYTQAVILPAGVYTLSYKVFNAQTSTDGNNKLKTNKFGFVASSGKTFYGTTTTFTKSKWTEANTSFVLTTETSGNISIGAAFPAASSSVTPRLIVDGVTLTYKSFDEVTYENPADFTSLIVNPSFETGNSNGWTYKASSDTGVKPNSNGTYTTSGVDGNYLYNTWWKGTPLTQTVANLPNGIYQLNVLVASGDGDGTTPDIYLLANGEHSEVYTISDGNNKVFHDASYEFKVLNGQATIGVVGGNDDGTYNAEGHWWYKADNFRLTYKGVDLSIIKEAYETALANATAARDKVEYESVTGLERTNLLNAISLQPAENKSELEAATTALLNATTAFTASKPDYDALATEKTIAEGLGVSEESIASATATTKTGLVALQDLKVAEYNYIKGSYTENATLGSWIEDFGGDLDGEGYKAGGPKYLDDWQGNKTTRTAKQTVTLPAGDYALSIIARGQAGASGNLYYKIGDVTTDVALIMKGNRGRGVDVNGVANFSEEGEYNCNGEGFGWEYRFITFHLDTETQVEIGASVTIQGQWASVYAPVLLTTEASVKALRLSEIATALGNVPTGKMDATVQAELNDAVAAAENVTSASTIDELNSVSTALAEAIDNAKASVADYAAIKTYIEKANNIDASIAANYKAQYDNGNITETATNVFQTLEVATYNYVTEEFSYPVALSSDWNTEGPVGELSDQHWSGEKRPYMEQSGAAWGSNAWEISYDQDLTLPAGEYVFKVAGRKASGTGCTLELIVTKGDETLGTVNDFPEGDTGYGIDTSGAANFSDEGEYANNDKGRAWQWRYVKFTLGEPATVNIAVKAKATTNHQWISFCDATVQMTEETYLEANMGGLGAPTAAAEALVDTKPMGTAKNDALKTALALPVTTGAELKAKIEALNTAVANANTWVAEYNAAKAPLVAALERFETDYNKDGVKMSQTVWNNILDKVKAAAVAKDVTDSYDGFKTAADNLNAALDILNLDETAGSIGDVDGRYTFVTVNRTIKPNTWSTFVVPFNMAKPEGWEVKKLAGSTMNGDNITLTFSDADAIEAGVPYMVRVASDVNMIDVKDVTVKTILNNTETDHIDFVGVYANGYVPEGSFFISNNKFYRAADNTNTMKAFRAYLQPKGGANIKAVGYSFDDVDATFVEGVEDAMTAEPVAVYGADGALRTGLQKGLNIVKMSDGKVKKVFVK